MSDVPTSYDLALDTSTKIIVPTIILIFIVVGVFGAIEALGTDQSAAIFFVFWFGVLSFMVFQVVSLPLHIDDDGNGTITFRSLARSRRVRVSTITSIEPVRGQFGFLRLRHQAGSVVFLNQFTGFHRLVAALVLDNPRISLKGC